MDGWGGQTDGWVSEWMDGVGMDEWGLNGWIDVFQCHLWTHKVKTDQRFLEQGLLVQMSAKRQNLPSHGRELKRGARNLFPTD